jgi:hypothetical protein
MLHEPRVQAPSSDDETLAMAIARAARGASWATLMACAAVGALGIPVGWFVAAHRILLVSAALTMGAFGSGGLAERILTDELASGDPDRVLLIGFAAVRWVSIVVGTCAALVFLAWIFFALLGGSFRL